MFCFMLASELRSFLVLRPSPALAKGQSPPSSVLYSNLFSMRTRTHNQLVNQSPTPRAPPSSHVEGGIDDVMLISHNYWRTMALQLPSWLDKHELYVTKSNVASQFRTEVGGWAFVRSRLLLMFELVDRREDEIRKVRTRCYRPLPSAQSTKLSFQVGTFILAVGRCVTKLEVESYFPTLCCVKVKVDLHEDRCCHWKLDVVCKH